MAGTYDREQLMIVGRLLDEAIVVAESIDDTLLAALIEEAICCLDQRLAPTGPRRMRR